MTAGCFKCHVFVVGIDSFLACYDVAFDLCLWGWYHQGFCPFLTEICVVMLSDRNRSLCCFCSVCWAYGQKVCMDQWLLKGADRHRQTDRCKGSAPLDSLFSPFYKDTFCWPGSGNLLSDVRISQRLGNVFTVAANKGHASGITANRVSLSCSQICQTLMKM